MTAEKHFLEMLYLAMLCNLLFLLVVEVRAACPVSPVWNTYTAGSGGFTLSSFTLAVSPAGQNPICLATDPLTKYPVFGHMAPSTPWRCKVQSPLPGTAISATAEVSSSFQYIAAPQADQELLWIPLTRPIMGLDLLRDQDCAVSGDQGNLTAVNPVTGRLFSAISRTPANVNFLYAGVYSPLLGKMLGYGLGYTTDAIHVLVLRPKIRLQAPPTLHAEFTCLEDMAATGGVNIGPIRYVKGRTHCIYLCMLTSNGCESINGVRDSVSRATPGIFGCQMQSGWISVAPNGGTADVDVTCLLQN